MRKPTICFLGDYEHCHKIIDHFNSSVKSRYISKGNDEPDIFSSIKPNLICFILEKGSFGHNSYYSSALSYSKRTMCPIYVISTHDQFDGMKKACYRSVIRKVTELGVYRVIRNSIKTFRDLPNGSLAMMKERFDNIAVISSNAALTAFAESRIRLRNTPERRIIVSSPSSCETMELLENKNNLSGFVITEPLNAVELERISLELSEMPNPKIPLIFLEHEEHYHVKGKFSNYNIKNDGDEISKEFSRAHKAKIKNLSFGKDTDDSENSL